MEDRPQNTEQEEVAEVKEKSKDNFLDTWLKFLRAAGRETESEENAKKEKDSEVEESHTNQEKSPRKNFWDRFSDIFKDMVSPPESKSSKTQEALQEENDNLKTANQEVEIELGETTDQPQDFDSVEAVESNRLAEPEQIGEIARRVEKSTVAGVPAAELLRKQPESKPHKEVAKLKKEAKSLEKEREELVEQQQAFEKQLDRKMKHDQEAKSPKLSMRRPKNGEPKSRLNPEESPLTPDALEEILKSNPSNRPEVIMERVEVAATHDLPIESMYERRHEQKDESSSPLTSKYDLPVANRFKKQAQSLREISARSTLHHSSAAKNAKSPIKQLKHQPELYKQAIVSGFWTAVFLLAVIFILVLLS